jgi:catechol 2,3-dioxygenase-like lactoylglutathione lyase family enzyme
MDIRLTSTVFQIFARDVQRSLDFYRLLGLPVPQSQESHVAVELPGGNTLSFDTEETIAGMHPGWGAACIAGEPPRARVRGRFPGDGRCVVRKSHGRRACRAVGTIRCAVGDALCDGRRPGRQLGGSVRAAGILTQRRQRHAGEFADFAVQVGLVGIPGTSCHLCVRQSVAQ